MSCGSCGREARAGARFCDACGRALAAPRSPRAYTPPHLAERILATRSALAGERKQVTVLFADVVESTPLSERLGPERWHRVLDRFFQLLAAEIHRFEGTINQFTGDGVMALFGAPLAHEDHARLACHAALAVRQELRRYGEELFQSDGVELRTRIGLNSGEVVVGRIGDDLRMDYTAQGQSVAIAARVEHLAEPGEVFLAAATADLLRGYFELLDRGAVSMRGVKAPVRLFQLGGPGPLRTRLDASRERGFSTLLERGHELAALERAFEAAAVGEGRVVAVSGDPGVGKSRLVDEFTSRVRRRGAEVYVGRCAAHGQSIPLFSIRQLLSDYFALSEQLDERDARSCVAAGVSGLDPGLTPLLPAALALLGLRDAAAQAAPPQALPRFLARWVQARAARAEGLLVIEDAHWIDAESDALLRVLVDALGWTRTLLVVNFRPEYRPDWLGLSYVRELALDPLGEQGVATLLDELLGPDASLVALRAELAQRAGGNPLFLEELVRALASSGRIRGQRGAYRHEGPPAPLELPGEIHALLSERIDGLGEEDKHVLQVASAIGTRIARPILARVTGLAEDALARSLARLQSAALLEPGLPGADLEFRHPLTREVAYTAQLADRRATLHAEIARALEDEHRSQLGRHASLIAHHWDQADRGGRARRWRARAALQVAQIQLPRHERGG